MFSCGGFGDAQMLGQFVGGGAGGMIEQMLQNFTLILMNSQHGTTSGAVYDLNNLNSIYHFNLTGDAGINKTFLPTGENFMEQVISTDASTSLRVQGKAGPLVAGIITGQLAGLIMAVVVMLVFALFLGHSPLYPVQVIGSVLFGEAALHGFHLGALLAGLILHQLGPSLLWGAAFGLMAAKLEPRTAGSALLIGLGLGVVTMTGPYLLIPAVMKAMQGVDIWNREVPMFWDWAAHIVFGASFALYPMVVRKLKGE
jgi:hypothetical protein